MEKGEEKMGEEEEEKLREMDGRSIGVGDEN